MKDYRVEFLSEASAEVAALDKTVAQHILNKLKWLAENFTELTPEPLGDKLKGLFKLRVGNYRVFYSFNREKRSITIHLVGHRREIYKS